MGIVLKNNATSTITTAINASDVGLAVAAGTGSLFPTLGVGDYFYATLVSAGGTYEVIKVTARVGDTMTIVRAQEGTTAQSFTSGSRIELRVTAASITDLVGEYDQASEISFTPTGTISSTNVQNAIAEVSGDVTAAAAALAATTGAALVGKTGGGTVQDAINTIGGLPVSRGGASGDPTTLRKNIAAGDNALAANTFVEDGYDASGIFYDQGSWNIAIGDEALKANTTGHRNIGIGYEAGTAITTGYYNTIIGARAGVKLTSGLRNIYIGVQAGQEGTTGSDNTAVGSGAMLQVTTGYENAAFGHLALSNITSGFYNVAIGRQAGLGVTTGSNNVFAGYQAGSAVTSGTNNIAIGAAALGSATTVSGNVAIGYRALSPATGADNTAIGVDAGVAVTTGNRNTLIGNTAGGNLTTGIENVVIGYAATASSASVSYEITLGSGSNDKMRVPGVGFYVSTVDLQLPKTSTAGGTTGAQTINKPAGSVNFAAAATSLVVTNSLVTTSSVIIATVATNDSTMKSVAAVAGSGSFTLHANAAATAETRVSFLVIN